jgi:hypothetical protein
MSSCKTYICGCVRDCDKHLTAVFKNIETIAKMFDDYHIIMAFDTSADLSLKTLCEQKRSLGKKMEILVNREPLHDLRTVRIANARNTLLNRVNELNNTPEYKDFGYFIMIDMDDVCSAAMRPEVLQKVIDRERANDPLPWDTLSFNRPGYYDVWALSVDPCFFSCWHFARGRDVVKQMRQYIDTLLKEVNPGELFQCVSAFNGFAIYRNNGVFYDSNANRFIQYEGTIAKTLELMPHAWIETTAKTVDQPVSLHRPDECEHRPFHLRAILLNNARICISPECLFTEWYE